MTFGERLTKLRTESKYNTRKLLAEQLGIPETTLRNYEKDDREPGHTFLIQIAEFFDVSIDWLLGVSEEKERRTDYKLTKREYSIVELYRSLDDSGKEMVDFTLEHETKRANTARELQKKSNRRSYAYYGKIAAAGSFVSWEDALHGTVECEPCDKDADFTVGVSGDSMEPTFSDGDIVFVKSTSEINKGEIGIFKVDGYIYIKERGEDGLISHNRNYPMIKGGEITCIGKVVGKANWL